MCVFPTLLLDAANPDKDIDLGQKQSMFVKTPHVPTLVMRESGPVKSETSARENAYLIQIKLHGDIMIKTGDKVKECVYLAHAGGRKPKL